MSFFSKLIDALSKKKRRDDEWGARFTATTPAQPLSLDPGRSMLMPGKRVVHTDGSTGTVTNINMMVTPASVFVKWDDPRRNVPHPTHGADMTHVKITSLKEIA